MAKKAPFKTVRRNPDVLSCIANLSSDEVFTPPQFANKMLDTLTDSCAADNGGANIWADKTVKFLDPGSKSGVFLREITRRLTEGLEGEIPSLKRRVNHILTKQVFGIGTTQLTSLLTRENSALIGEIETPGEDVAFVADSYLMLRYVEIESAIRKALLVLKLRSSDHAKDIRQYEITRSGIEVQSKFEGREGIMSGSPRRMADSFVEAFVRR